MGAKYREIGAGMGAALNMASSIGAYTVSDRGTWLSFGNKGDLYEGGVRVPLIVRWPGQIKPGSTFDKPVYSTDYFPTFFDLVGLELDPNTHPDGKSMLAIWKGKNSDDEQRTFYWHFPHRQNPASSVRDADWKLVHTIKSNTYELFDLKSDPYEAKDISSKYSDKTKRLRVLLEEHLKKLDAQRMRPNSDYDGSKPEGKQKNYGIHYYGNGSIYQQVKDPYPSWFKEQ